MMRAIYSTENIGHYGLAAEHYLHFTSPIRRYPDLVTHRLLKEAWAQRHGQPVRETPAAVLAELAAISSERERAAMEAEREIAAYYAALFMKDKVGERFDGVVSAVVEFGIFVELTRWFVEGLVKVEDLGGAPELDTELHALVDRTTGRAFRVGDEVTVEVVSASPVRRRIELSLVEEVRAAVKGQRRRGAEQVLAEAEAEVEAAARRPRGRREPVAAPKAAQGERRQRTGDGHREHGAESGRARSGDGPRERGAAGGRARSGEGQRGARPAGPGEARGRRSAAGRAVAGGAGAGRGKGGARRGAGAAGGRARAEGREGCEGRGEGRPSRRRGTRRRGR
jgi:ribonuclease R